MNFKTTIAALALALGLAQGAAAATIDFTSAGTGPGGVVGAGPLTYSASASHSLLPASVSVSANGLGVSHFLDTQPGQIDSALTTSETLTITFSWAVNLLDFTLTQIGIFDDFEVAFNGGGFTAFGPGLSNPYVGLGQNNVTSFSIRASSAGLRDIANPDTFTLAAANVAPVPVPAAGLMLMAGLGGLAALRRRKALV